MKLVVEIDNVTSGQAKAFEHLFAVMNMLGRRGCSRTLHLPCDGDGNFRPSITVNGADPELDPERDADTNTMKPIRVGMNW